VFKRSLVVPVKIEGPEDFLGLSRAGLEVYINELLTQRGIAEKFFGSLEGQVSRVSVIVGERDLTFYVTFQDEAMAYESELREQIPFIMHSYLRPLIENVSIPNNDCTVYFVNPAPVGIYTRNLFMDELGLKINDYGTNFVSATDSRRKQWESEKLRFGFDNRETWCLDTTFVEW
jgi:hypothetical protein